MNISLIITILGDDKPGLVRSISEVLGSHTANWSESRMAHLAGKFAGILEVSVSENNLKVLSSALENLQTDGLKIQIETAQKIQLDEPTETLQVGILCQDRIGIINDVTQVLASLNVNIEDLESTVKEASMAGGMLFDAKLTLGLPKDITAESVEDALEKMSDQLMIDINLS